MTKPKAMFNVGDKVRLSLGGTAWLHNPLTQPYATTIESGCTCCGPWGYRLTGPRGSYKV